MNTMIQDIRNLQKVLDEQEVPTEGRKIRFQGKDGSVVELAMDEKPSKQELDNIPEDMLEALGIREPL